MTVTGATGEQDRFTWYKKQDNDRRRIWNKQNMQKEGGII